MFEFLDSAVLEHAIGALHQAIATLRLTYVKPTRLEEPIYRAILKTIEHSVGTPLDEMSYIMRQDYITQLASKQRQLSARAVDLDETLGQQLLETLRKQHGVP